MNKPAFLLVALIAAPGLLGQYAPQSIADTLVDSSGVVSVFSSYELVYFRADGTYQQIVSQGVTDTTKGLQTRPPASGTYTYTTAPSPPEYNLYGPPTTGLDGTVTFTGGTIHAPLGVGFPVFGEGSPFVTVYPRISITGAVNVSNNSWVTATHPTTPGFVIQGNSPRWVLLRGAGPSLAQFGVASPLENPAMILSGWNILSPSVNMTRSSTEQTTSINPWSADPNLMPGLQAIFSMAGAFQYLDGSLDCAGLILLPPGAYTIQGSAPGADGELLTEVYVLPFGT